MTAVAAQPPNTRRVGAGPGQGPPSSRLLLGVLLGIVTFSFLFVSSFTTMGHDPEPHDVPVAIAGSPQVTAQLAKGLAAQAPGAIELRAYGDPASARQAVVDREVDGAVIAQSGGLQVLTAEAASQPSAELISGALAAAGQKADQPVRHQELAPLPQNDSRGTSAFFLNIGILVPSLMFGGALLVVGRGLALGPRLAVIALFAALMGLGGALADVVLVGGLDTGFGTFWAVAGLAVLLSGSVVMTAAALQSLFGPGGTLLAMLVLLVFGNAASGGPVAHHFMPDVYRQLSPYLPPGATVEAVRDTVYFSGHGAGAPALVLLAWTAVASLIVIARRSRGVLAPAPTGASSMASA